MNTNWRKSKPLLGVSAKRDKSSGWRCHRDHRGFAGIVLCLWLVFGAMLGVCYWLWQQNKQWQAQLSGVQQQLQQTIAQLSQSTQGLEQSKSLQQGCEQKLESLHANLQHLVRSEEECAAELAQCRQAPVTVRCKPPHMRPKRRLYRK